MTAFLIELLIRMVFSGAATFTAILLWSRTRDPAWMMVILGMVLLFGGIVYDLLSFFGIIQSVVLQGTPRLIAEGVLKSLPFLFFFIGFFIAARRRR
ncbi:hypothetical protein [Spirochaeta lutea]|uniref:Uncharacterized protein n=1 Tax=Spirochaeta lutea TaxID=1480694 RepID=A0A098QV43_9SPIO|nr:hypothetical protein [Spirochaeta lutea]KGE71609.1 hypothetical protein DC28_10055 [Spirochaeta lutea]